NSEEGYRRYITYNLVSSMLSDRLDELRQRADAPFSYSGAYHSTSSRSNSQFYTYAVGDATRLNESLNGLLSELERMRRFGFTATELTRAKNELLMNYERQYNERDKTQSKSLTSELVYYYLDKQPAPGIAWEYAQAKQKLPGITLDEINQLAQTWITDGSNCVIVVTAPDQKEVTVPTESQIRTAYAGMRNAEIAAYEDNMSSAPFFDKQPTVGTVTASRYKPAVGITEWKLSNGATVLVKPTEFNNDQILFKAVSLGGNSVFDDKDYYDATMAATLANRSGLGSYNNVALQKYLSDKTAKVSMSIGEFTEGLDGSATNKDLETLFQLVHLSFTAPRQDADAFASFRASQLAFIQNRTNSPEDVFWDTVQTVLSNYHYRRKPWTPEMVNKLDAANMHRIVKDRFSNAGDFTFVFVGSIDTAALKPYVLKYIASLPSNKKLDNYVDRNVRVMPSRVKRNVFKGSEPQSTVFIQYSGEAPFSREAALQASALEQLMRIKLRETLREEMSGVYGVGCNVNLAPHPRQEFKTAVNFGCSPENVSMLVAAVHAVIDSVKQHGASEKDMQKVRELMLKGRETSIRENSFWLSYISSSITNKLDVADVNRYNDMVTALKPVDFKRLANMYFNAANEATFVLYPETPQKKP
ncbi:MAG TPA: insulinase family protein, partial [Chitinophagales bacterium]|nr:insulinase family protein [Chitinophagales bacterium]